MYSVVVIGNMRAGVLCCSIHRRWTACLESVSLLVFHVVVSDTLVKLYDWSIAPNPRRVRMYLAEKGIEVSVVQAGAPDQVALFDWFLEISPRRRVPLLELDDGTQIGEAMAICRYFECTHPDPPLFGGDARETALVEMWEREAEANCLAAGGESVRNGHPGFAGRALPGYADATPQIPELVERGRMRYYDFLDRAETHLGSRDYLAGKRFSVADITAFCAIDFWQKFRLTLPEGHPNLARWYAAIGERPSALA